MKKVILSIALLFFVFSTLFASEPGQEKGITYNLRDSTETDTISAEVIMRVLEVAGERDVVVGDSLVVVGVLTFSQNIFCKLSFQKSTFMDTVKAPPNEWPSCLTVQDSANFTGAQFNSFLDFHNTRFYSNVEFYDVKFTRGANFRGAQFTGNAHFRDAQFTVGANFNNAQFTDYANFINTQFTSYADFSYAQFTDYVNFSNAQFTDDAYFSFAQFTFDAYFDDAQFIDDAYFSFAQFTGEANFNDSKFESAFDLEFCRSEKTFNLRDAVFVDTVKILLSGIKYNELNLNWKQIEGKICFIDHFKADTFRVVNALYYKHFQDVAHLYIPLQKNFRELGQFDCEDGCYFEMKTIERICATGISKFMLTIMWLTCGYGVRPEYTIYSSAVVIFLFAFLFYKHGAIEERKFKPTNEIQLISNDDRSRWERFRDAVYFSVNTFTTVGYGDWVPTANELLKIHLRPVWRKYEVGKVKFSFIGFNGWAFTLRFRTLAMLEGLAGWLLLAMFLITLARKYVR